MAGLSCGIVGLPNVGKSTLFSAMTAVAAEASNYPFCTIEPNVGVVEVADPRLAELAELSGSKEILPATMQFVDIAGLVEGASKGEGLGNKFLSHIRQCDAVLHLVRCFESEGITHVTGSVDPIRDIEVINLELCLADLQTAENALVKAEKQGKGKKEAAPLIDCLKKVVAHLNESRPVRALELTDEEREILKQYTFLTAKKMLYVCNVGEADLPGMVNPHVERVREYAEIEGSGTVAICAQIEEEIAELPGEERVEFLKSVGLEQSGLERLVKAAFELLGLITFLTTGEMETRAWTIRRGSSAVEAAGKIHTDIQKGFIRAEVVSYDEMVQRGGRVQAREAGVARSEGRDYTVKDGDVILFMHN